MGVRFQRWRGCFARLYREDTTVIAIELTWASGPVEARCVSRDNNLQLPGENDLGSSLLGIPSVRIERNPAPLCCWMFPMSLAGVQSMCRFIGVLDDALGVDDKDAVFDGIGDVSCRRVHGRVRDEDTEAMESRSSIRPKIPSIRPFSSRFWLLSGFLR